jgi:hypothetical protein
MTRDSNAQLTTDSTDAPPSEEKFVNDPSQITGTLGVYLLKVRHAIIYVLRAVFNIKTVNHFIYYLSQYIHEQPNYWTGQFVMLTFLCLIQAARQQLPENAYST